MNKILLGIFILFSMATAGYCQQKNIVWFPFVKIEQNNGLIRLQFPAQEDKWQAIWLMGLNTDKPADFRLSHYSEIVELKVGDKLELDERHEKIVFEAIYQDKQIFLKITSTVRKPGWPLETKSELTPVTAL